MFGADVDPRRVDGASRRRPADEPPPADVPQWWERSPYFHATNTNKRDVTIDMSSAEGRALALRLVAECDVIVENYSPRVMESWGLSWDDVRAVNPTAIMVRMPAFGLSGPWRDRTGFAMTMEQVSGMAWLRRVPRARAGRAVRAVRPGRRAARADRAVRRPGAPPPHRRGSVGRGADGRQRAQRRRRAGHRVLGPRRPPRPHGQPRPGRGAAEQLRRVRLGRRPRPAPLGVARRGHRRAVGGAARRARATRRGPTGPSWRRWPGAMAAPRRARPRAGGVVRRAQGRRDRRPAVAGRRARAPSSCTRRRT